MHDNLNLRAYQTASVSVASTGDKARFAPSYPIRVRRWGFINLDTGAVDVGAGLVVSLDKRPTTGSDTNRVELDTISTGTTDVAVGKGLYSEFANGFNGQSVSAIDGSTINVAPSHPDNVPPYPTEVNPGQELVFEVKDAADTAGAAVEFFIHYEENPWADGTEQNPRLANMTKVAS